MAPGTPIRSRTAGAVAALTLILAAACAPVAAARAAHRHTAKPHATGRAIRAGILAASAKRSDARTVPSNPLARAALSVSATVTNSVIGNIPAGFLGISTELRGIEGYTGDDPKAVNPVFEQLIRNLDPDQRPVLRLGGDTGDWSWYPIKGMARPEGVRYSLSPRWLAVMKSLAINLDARMIVAVNLEVDSARVAATEARALISGIGKPWLEALQLGNEPELYDVLAWYAINNKPVFGRPPDWSTSSYLSNYAQIVRAMPNFPLAGPEVGVQPWVDAIGQFLDTEPRVRIVTVHQYPLGCNASQTATIGELLSDAATRDFGDSFGPALAAGHAHGLPVRMDEMNTVSCGGQEGLSNTFAAALWSLDAMFELARRGFAGANVHTREGIANQLFQFTEDHGVWRAQVEPIYYGLLAFAEAVPAGSRLLAVNGVSSGAVHAWAVRPPSGPERIVLINMGTKYGRLVYLGPGSRGEHATVERLRAPSAAATGGVTLNGQSFADNTTTGLLRGRPRIESASRTRTGYSVWLPAASAAIVTLGR